MEQDFLKRITEALIFASDEPLSIKQICDCISNISPEEVKDVIALLSQEYSDAGRVFFLKRVGGGFQFATKPEYYKWIKHLYEGRMQSRLTRASLEALAIIAFKQPVTKVEVSMIRGVNSDGVIKNLLMRRLITMMGRATSPGRPLLYGTSPEFLRYFGLNSLEDLPKPKEIEELLTGGEGAAILSDFAEVDQDKYSQKSNYAEESDSLDNVTTIHDDLNPEQKPAVEEITDDSAE
jgi:segregation and condensation protein B